jgi:23S rRNA (cytidine1920-2'-O)/16S rRNA (cytidine1409-2'-O)-methyltransferase
LLTTGAWLVTLIKPQFEAGRAQVSRGGVVRDPAVHDAVVAGIREFGVRELPLEWVDVCESPLKGPAGNKEFLAAWRKK